MFSSAEATRKSSAQQGGPGNILSIFEQKPQGGSHERFSELKKAIWKDSMLESWAQVLDALKEKTELVGVLGPKVG